MAATKLEPWRNRANRRQTPANTGFQRASRGNN